MIGGAIKAGPRLVAEWLERLKRSEELFSCQAEEEN
jgi:hypothetical protein